MARTRRRRARAPCRAPAEGGVAGAEGVRPRHARARIGRDGDRRRHVRQHAVIEDEEMRRQRRDAQHAERGRGHRHHDDVGRGGRHAAAQQDADDRRQHEGEEQRRRLHLEAEEGQRPHQGPRPLVGQGGHDPRDLEADARERDDAHDDADGRRRRTDADGVFRADDEGVRHVVQDAHPFRAARQHAMGADGEGCEARAALTPGVRRSSVGAAKPMTAIRARAVAAASAPRAPTGSR